ncbi:MAG: hypothetical protein P1P85_00030 [Patescibacteria group bacterium]|nr:hypothetical protein [Patescibacteria group bacterium]
MPMIKEADFGYGNTKNIYCQRCFSDKIEENKIHPGKQEYISNAILSVDDLDNDNLKI